jgi:DNA-binding SARP family transcriptional activator
LRILDVDPYDEEAHLDLVRALIAQRRHGEARRAYRTYCAKLAELDLEPAPFP